MHGPGDSQEPSSRGPTRHQVSGFSAILEVLRGLPARLKRPETLLMLLAMLASLGAHMPPWVGLGALADYFERIDAEKRKRAELPPAEVTFEVAEAPKPVQPELPEPAQPPKPETKKEPEPDPQLAKLELPEPPKPELPKPEQPQPAVPPPPPQDRRKQSITQKSDDPNVEPPPDAKYLAEESRRVEEETVAKVTDEHHDDEEANEAAPQAAGPEESGESVQEQKGRDKGLDESREEKVASAERAQNKPAMPPPGQEAEPAKTEQPARQAIREVAPRAETPAPTVVQDPLGSFVLAPTTPGQEGRKGQSAREAVAGNAGKIKVSWSAFEATFGAEQLAQDRLPREAKRRGAGREKRWEEFRAAIENYIVGAKPGNTTALNAAADPFAAYLAAFHRNLHGEFAHEFLSSLPALGELSDRNLVTKVEIVVNPDGSLDRVGVVKSSGNLMYDFGAFNAVQRGAPYPVPPEKIRSPDGRVYLHWALHRDESQCGTWNAEPYILRNPPRSPSDPKPDNVSPYRPAGTSDPFDSKSGRAPSHPRRERLPGDRPRARVRPV